MQSITMMTESTAEALVTYGFPLFWTGVGIVQWFWPSAIFVAFSDDDVTPGARAFAVLWLVVGATLGYFFVPWLHPFGGWAIPGLVLVIVGGLQFLHPLWTGSDSGRSERTAAVLLVVSGLAALLFGLL